MSDPVPERLEAAMLGGHWQSSLQALSMDSVLPCWPFLNLVVPEISAIVVCKLAKVAYMAFQNGERNPYFADYSPNHIYEVVTRFRTQISVECGQNVEITITNWVLEEFPRSASDCLIEMQLHSVVSG